MTITPTRPAARRETRPMDGFADSATMLRRNLRHLVRYPALIIATISVPVIMLLLFAYLFGDTISAGVGGPAGGVDYIDYLVPGILLMTIASGAVQTAVQIRSDMNEGIVDRFRTMPISRTAVVTGHVLGSVILNVVTVVSVIGVGLALGFRPTAGLLEWLAVTGLTVLISFAITWLAVTLGLLAKTVEGASNTPMVLSFFLPFLSTTFIPLASLPSGIRWFAEYQPYTPIIQTLRGLLIGGPIGHNGWLAVCWGVALTIGGYVWSKRLFARDPQR
ncbi:ABC transporter permease [Actinophytocola sp.]|uniref:ABC transporter permease n=1 Tax=Actinophytocola sp. TaxID=1872138 RepID=UPI002D66D5DB|nr:ABC transporter permease [Actinophytocola sp.]HYQ69806.1 ABC transporter permease [Actinophytocola sp.]